MCTLYYGNMLKSLSNCKEYINKSELLCYKGHILVWGWFWFDLYFKGDNVWNGLVMQC